MTVCPCVLDAVHLYVPSWERCMLIILSVCLFCVRDPPTCCHVNWLDVGCGLAEVTVHVTDNAWPSITFCRLNDRNSGLSMKQERYWQYRNIKLIKVSAHSLKRFSSPLFQKLSFFLYAPFNSDECHASFHLNAVSQAARKTEQVNITKKKSFKVGFEPPTWHGLNVTTTTS